jgi:hypothetical protein
VHISQTRHRVYGSPTFIYLKKVTSRLHKISLSWLRKSTIWTVWFLSIILLIVLNIFSHRFYETWLTNNFVCAYFTGYADDQVLVKHHIIQVLMSIQSFFFVICNEHTLVYEHTQGYEVSRWAYPGVWCIIRGVWEFIMVTRGIRLWVFMMNIPWGIKVSRCWPRGYVQHDGNLGYRGIRVWMFTMNIP